MPPGRRRTTLVAVIAAVVVLAAAVAITVLLVAENDQASAWSPGAQGASTTATATTPDQSASSPPSGSRALPPPTPTGTPYEDEDPQIGACADLGRRQTGVIIYQADCADPAATLILESIQPDGSKCPGKGYFGLNALSKQLLCFTYNFVSGDCIDMSIPRRTSCEDTSGASARPPIVTVTEVLTGQRDGTACSNPNLIFQVGQGDRRGVACLAPAKANASATPLPSR